MKLSRIRAVDFWLGWPICLFLDLFAFFLSPFLRRNRNIKNIMLMELSEAGSLIIGYSAIKRIKTALPDANLYFLIFDRHANGLKLLNLIDGKNIFTIRDSSALAFLGDVLRAVWSMRKAGVDSIIDMELFSRASSILSFMSLASNRVGFYAYTNEGLYRGRLIHNYKVAYNPYKHMSLNFMALAEALLGNENDSPNLKRKLPDSLITPFQLPDAKKRAENGLALVKIKFPQINSSHKITLVNPNAGELPIRAWELEKFAETSKRILESGDDRLVVIMGLPDAMNDGVFIEQYVKNPRCINLIGVTQSLGDVADLCCASRVVLTNDSGPAQYASITPAHVVALFGPETPALYSPLGERAHTVYSGVSCSPCVTASNHRNTVCTDNKCLQIIGVDEVAGLCLDLLK